MIAAAVGFLFGLLIGSFLNVCIYRMPKDLSVVTPRSFCPSCKNMVAWYDNVPLLSYVLLHGRCRHCKTPIPFRYPVVELLTACLFAAITASSGLTLLSVKLCVFVALIIGLIFSDLEERILPDQMTLGGMLAGFVFAAIVPFEDGIAFLFVPPEWGGRAASIIESVLGAFITSFLLWVIGELYFRIRKREGLGFGDVKMVGMIGAFLGLQGALLTVVLGSILGSVLGLLYIYATRKEASSYELPFGTFLGVGALSVALLRSRALSVLGWMG